MTMDPNAPQQPGFLSRIGQGLGNLFSGYQEAPQVGGATDPFAGLSRNQRMLLGFSALRDAAASLEGRDSDYFNRALGGFEQARERERLRQQGLFQNQVQGAQALALIQQQIILGQRLGQDVSGLQAMADQIQGSLMGGFGATPTAGAIPTGGVVQPTATGTTLPAVPGYEAPSVTGAGGAAAPETGVVRLADGTVVEEYTGEPEAVPTEEVLPSVYDPSSFTSVADIRAAQAELRQQATELSQRGTITVGGYTDDPTAQIAAINSLIDDLDQRAADIVAAQQEQAEQAGTAERIVIPQVEAALSYMITGYEDGQPVFNPALLTRAGRWIEGARQTPEYQQFAGAIETLGTRVLLDALENVTVGALSEGEREALTASQGALDINNPLGTYDAIMEIQRVARQSIERRNREAGITTSGGVSGEWVDMGNGVRVRVID